MRGPPPSAAGTIAFTADHHETLARIRYPIEASVQVSGIRAGAIGINAASHSARLSDNVPMPGSGIRMRSWMPPWLCDEPKLAVP
jgi:hypothetical protein